jgi:hypothetical protein
MISVMGLMAGFVAGLILGLIGMVRRAMKRPLSMHRDADSGQPVVSDRHSAPVL